MRRSLRGLVLFAALGVVISSCESSSPTQPSPGPCTYLVSPATLSLGPAGGVQTVTVTAESHCAWSAASDSPWISITAGASGTGTGVVTVNVAANPGTAMRTGILTVAGQAITVRVDGLEPCTFEISPASASFNERPATGSFSVNTQPHCSWTAVSAAPWLTVTGGSPGTGSGTVSYAVEANAAIAGRSGTIAVGERTFTVTQAGDPSRCEYSVAPVTLSPCMAATTLSVAVTTEAGCSWTAETSVPWITLTGGQTGDGTGTITMSVTDNWAPPRQGLVMVRWPTPTAGQNVQVSQAGCHYAVTTPAIGVGAGGGAGSVGVFQQSEPTTCGGPLQNACVWIAQSTVPWITVTTAMPQVGDGQLSFVVAPNAGAARTGTIVVQDRVVTITQAGP
jgi:hypothetical protein